MRQLDFKNGVHHVGLNTTVRRGYKWANLNLGETVQLCTNGVPNEKDFVTATIVSLSVRTFSTIIGQDIEAEHDPDCRTYEGLKEAMIRAYGEDFKTSDPCVIIDYLVGGSPKFGVSVDDDLWS